MIFESDRIAYIKLSEKYIEDYIKCTLIVIFKNLYLKKNIMMM